MAESQNSTPETAEEWRAVVGYEGVYEVSNRGRVRRIGGRSGFPRRSPARLLRPGTNSQTGYPYVVLSRDGRGGTKTITVHTLVASAFLGPRKPRMHVNHIDSDRTNARLDNLEYVTHSQNAAHAVRHRRAQLGMPDPPVPVPANSYCARGERVNMAKVTAAQVREIRERYADGAGPTLAQLAREYGLCKNSIGNILSRRTWKHI